MSGTTYTNTTENDGADKLAKNGTTQHEASS